MAARITMRPWNVRFCLILAVLTTYTLASVDSKVTKMSPRWIDPMSRVEEGPLASPVQRMSLRGSAPGSLDGACLTPIAFDYLNGEPRDVNLTTTDQSGTSTTIDCIKNGVACPRTSEGLVLSEYHSIGVPFHYRVVTLNRTFTLTLASGQLNASTTCLLERYTYAEDPIFIQGVDSFSLSGGDLAGQGEAVVTCYSLDLTKQCCDGGKLKRSGAVCRRAPSPCTKAATCDGVSAECLSNPLRPDGSHCPWYPRPAGHPYWTDASTLKRSAATEEEATALLMTAKPAYGWPHCEGRCHDGMCALRFDHPECCAVPDSGDDYGRYASDAEASTATGTTPLWEGKWQHDAGEHGQDLYCWKH